MTIVATTETVTPQQAELWLEYNNIETNRNITHSRIRRYTSDMLNGKWGLGQPLMFTESGTLIDGQHRLSAVVNSGVDVEFVILRGYDKSALLFIDTGKSRSTANIARVNDKRVNNYHLSCFSGMFYAPSSSYTTCRYFSDQEKIEKSESVFDALDFACKGHDGAGKTQEGRIRNSTVNGVVARAYYYENHERLEAFLEGFRSGFTSDENDHAVIALRNLYMNLKNSTSSRLRGVTNINQDIFNYTQLALTHFLKQNPVRNLRLPKGPKNIWHVEVVDGPKKK